MQDGQHGSVARHKSLESRAQGKLANAVRGGADGKGPRNRDLAGGLLHFEDEPGRRLPGLVQPSDALAALRTLMLNGGWERYWQQREVLPLLAS